MKDWDYDFGIKMLIWESILSYIYSDSFVTDADEQLSTWI